MEKIRAGILMAKLPPINKFQDCTAHRPLPGLALHISPHDSPVHRSRTDRKFDERCSALTPDTPT